MFYKILVVKDMHGKSSDVICLNCDEQKSGNSPGIHY